MIRFSHFAAVTAIAAGTVLSAGCAFNPHYTTTSPDNAQPASAQMNAGPTTLPYNGGVYDMNGPNNNAGNNDRPSNSGS